MAIGAGWTLLVAFSRLRMGAHFLSDVSVSALLTIGLGAVGVWLFYFNRTFFGKLWAFFSGEVPAKQAKKQALKPVQIHANPSTQIFTAYYTIFLSEFPVPFQKLRVGVPAF